MSKYVHNWMFEFYPKNKKKDVWRYNKPMSRSRSHISCTHLLWACHAHGPGCRCFSAEKWSIHFLRARNLCAEHGWMWHDLLLNRFGDQFPLATICSYLWYLLPLNPLDAVICRPKWPYLVTQGGNILYKTFCFFKGCFCNFSYCSSLKLEG